MKYTFFAIAALILGTLTATAQDTTAHKENRKKELSISNKGIYLGAADSAKSREAKRRWVGSISMDLGVNFLQDNTNYTDPRVISYLSNVPADKRNADLFSLRNSKSINVNLYWMKTFRALRGEKQKINISTGLGLQLYNFRYDNNITYTKDPSAIIMDTVKFTKNKLGMDYLNVPLMFNFKTRLHHSADSKKSTWLVYGVGITAGYNISTWTKQVSGERGKVKQHDDYNFNPFNSCLTAEIGIDDVIRFYGTYQWTNLYNNGIEQHPISIGIKIAGI